ncbi:MAG: NUDIX domain-containing protein [Anaerolineae bacterium]|nr:NUDIX domain-containing protein [Anaerolineae bacterium]
MGSASDIAQTTRHRYTTTPRTLIFVTHGDDVLLVRGAPHKGWWAGRLNGVGGHIERDEDVLTSAWRELHEETGLSGVEGVRLAAIVNAALGDGPNGLLLFVFTARATSRDVVASDEGTLEWIPCADLDAHPVIPDLRVLLPRILALPPHAPPLFGHYWINEGGMLTVQFAGELPAQMEFPTVS